MYDRSEVYSIPGTYFSLLEYIEEELGLYGTETNLHNYYKNAADEFIDNTGLTKLGKSWEPAAYFEQYLKKQFRIGYTFEQFINDSYFFIKQILEYILWL